MSVDSLKELTMEPLGFALVSHCSQRQTLCEVRVVRKVDIRSHNNGEKKTFETIVSLLFFLFLKKMSQNEAFEKRCVEFLYPQSQYLTS